MWDKGLAPISWCQGLITPIHKEGPKDDPTNYRGLCIMNALLKLICTMMYQRLQQHISDNNTLKLEQIGFKQKARTLDHICIDNKIISK